MYTLEGLQYHLTLSQYHLNFYHLSPEELFGIFNLCSLNLAEPVPAGCDHGPSYKEEEEENVYVMGKKQTIIYKNIKHRSS